MCRKPAQLGDLKPFTVKPRPALPGSPRKAPAKGAAKGDGSPSAAAAAAGAGRAAEAADAAPWKSSTKLRALIQQIHAMKQVWGGGGK